MSTAFIDTKTTPSIAKFLYFLKQSMATKLSIDFEPDQLKLRIPIAEEKVSLQKKNKLSEEKRQTCNIH